jgi:signal transduction histidine kinase
MTADQLIQYLSWAFYILIFVVAVVRAIRQPRRANVDIALFFSVSTAAIGIGVAGALGLIVAGPLSNAISTTLLLALGYTLLRLVDDFAIVPRPIGRGSAALLALFALAAFAIPPPRPLLLNLTMGVYLVAVLAYASASFVRAAHRASGVTRRRMRAVALGALLLVLLFVIATLSAVAPLAPEVSRVVSDVVGLASGISFYLGFAPPSWLRRAWQEPELRAFLGRAASLPRLPGTDAIIGELERGAIASIGASGAVIGLWDEAAGVLHFPHGEASFRLDPSDTVPAARAFREQRALYDEHVLRDYPQYNDINRRYGVNAMLVAPITAGARRLGVLIVYAPRAPIFADDDLALVQLLADQAAVILESRGLIDEATQVRAREEAARLKDDFLSAAAHDLKTPLTTLVARAQYMERRAQRDPAAPADLGSIQMLVQEGQRLKRLVLELLDAARAERGGLLGDRAPTDLAALARGVAARHSSARHRIDIADGQEVVGEYDQLRIEQLLENLVENAVKYTPDGGAIRLRVWREAGEARLTVSDSGIGIPAGDLPHIFDRFYRAGNVDDRRFAGMGLGLFICRAIAEQHGGRIWVTSQPGQGSTFHIALPLAPVHTGLYAA